MTSVTVNDANEIIVGGVFDMASDTLTLTLAATDAGSGVIKKTFTLEAVASLPTTLTIVETKQDDGTLVRAVGDLDGDGFDDLVAHIDGADMDEYLDEVAFIAGSAFPDASVTPAVATLVPGVPASAEDALVYGVGDIDADGTPDLVFQGTTDKVMLVLSGKSSPVDTDLTLNFYYDHAVAGADINGDGITDALIGYSYALDNTNDEAGLYVVFGGADLSTSAVKHNVKIQSTDFAFAFALDGAGDVNGDGIDDVIIGQSPGESSRGLAYVLYGGAGFGAPFAEDKDKDQEALDALGTRGFRLVGDSHGVAKDGKIFAELGASVAGGGDFNGDGLDDVVIGAPANSFNDRRDASTSHENHGAAYVVFGSRTQNRGELDTTRPESGSGGSFRVTGDVLGADGFAIFDAVEDVGVGEVQASTNNLGEAVAIIGDVNGDGFDDLALGAYNASTSSSAKSTGRVYIVFGRAEGFDDIYLGEGNLDAQGIAVIQGPTAQDQFGNRLASAGDVDGDGLADLLIGSYYGSSYVVLGRELQKSTAAPKVEGATAARVGEGVNIAGTAARGEFLQGSFASNSITAIGSGDVAYGGAGNDLLSISAVDFTRAYGGSGTDALALSGADMVLDLTDHGRALAQLDSIEFIDLSGGGDNVVILNQRAVLTMTEFRIAGFPPHFDGVAFVFIDGNAGDMVRLEDFASWEIVGVGDNSTVYKNGNAVLSIEDDVTIADLAKPFALSSEPIRLYIPTTGALPSFLLNPADYFADLNAVGATTTAALTLSLAGFAELTEKHGFTAASIASNVLSLTGTQANSFTHGVGLSLTLGGDRWR